MIGKIQRSNNRFAREIWTKIESKSHNLRFTFRWKIKISQLRTQLFWCVLHLTSDWFILSHTLSGPHPNENRIQTIDDSTEWLLYSFGIYTKKYQNKVLVGILLRVIQIKFTFTNNFFTTLRIIQRNGLKTKVNCLIWPAAILRYAVLILDWCRWSS